MSFNLKTQKKLILSDPIAAFSSHSPDSNADVKAQLEDLWKKLQSLNDQHHEARTQTNILSRKIGEAKKSHQSADELIKSMQEQSRQCKQLADKLGVIENQILEFFINKKGRASQPSQEAQPEAATANRRYTGAINNVDEISIRIDDHKHNEWNSYVLNQPAATIHHRTEWQGLLQKTYGLESFYFSAYHNNKIVGVLPLTRLKSRLFGDLLVSMPYFQRGGAIADHPLIEHMLIQAANNHADQLDVDHIEYRDDIPRENLQVQSHKVNMVL